MGSMTDPKHEVIFHGLDPQAEVEITNRNLPHWFQIDATIFVTFRTADSIPREVRLRWQRELEDWLVIRKLPIELATSTVNQRLPNHDSLIKTLSAREQSEFRKGSDRIFHRSLDDCHGACPFKNPDLARIVGDAIRHGNEDRYDLDSFVVMPNHVHALVQFRQEGGLEIISQSWMRYSSRLINKAIGRSGPLWQPEPFDHIVRSVDQFTYLRKYIANNPKKAKLPEGEYLFWQR